MDAGALQDVVEGRNVCFGGARERQEAGLSTAYDVEPLIEHSVLFRHERVTRSVDRHSIDLDRVELSHTHFVYARKVV